VSCPIADIPYDVKLRAIKTWTINYEEFNGENETLKTFTFARIKLCKQHIGYQYTAIRKPSEDTVNEAFYIVRRFIWNYCVGDHTL